MPRLDGLHDPVQLSFLPKVSSCNCSGMSIAGRKKKRRHWGASCIAFCLLGGLLGPLLTAVDHCTLNKPHRPVLTKALGPSR